MGTSTKFSLVRGKAFRATRLNGCGQVVRGPDSKITTEGLISVGLTSNTEEGETISVTNAAGNVCILDRPSPKFTNYTVAIAFCGVDPELFSLMSGQPLVLDAAGTNAVGFGVDSTVSLSNSGFALEMWSGVPTNACVGGVTSYGYMLLPFITGGVLGDLTVENGAINFTLSGAVTQDGNNWGVGPYNVVRNVSNVAGPLNVAIPTTRHLHTEVTTVAPPAFSTTGSEAVGVPATSAVAGTPGTYLPANSYAPANLAGATGLTASPTSNWTTGQSVTLRDGSSMNWNGTAWVAGVHA